MRLNRKTKKDLIFFQNYIFRDKRLNKEEKEKEFALIINPELNWLKENLINLFEEEAEINSEIYIFSADLLNSYNPDKGELIGYLEFQLPWRTAAFLKEKQGSHDSPLLEDSFSSWELDEEYYWEPLKILTEDKYIGKVFTRGEKYIISKILSRKGDCFSVKGFADLLSIERKLMKKQITTIKEKLEVLEWQVY